MVHRDIKPDNIMVSSDLETVKIADFGIARLADSAASESTQVGTVLGTPRYMSPEQATGETVDARSDLFSVGVILYEMLTGHKAFDAESMPTLILQIMKNNPVPIRRLSPDIPAGLQNIVERLLRKKPERRFQSGAELFEALQHEQRALSDDETERNYIPLQIKWTAIMGAVVGLVMVISTTLVFRAQSEALRTQAVDAGVSLATFIAVQSAIPVLGEDWITLDSLVQDAASRRTFDFLIVMDRSSTIRSATEQNLVDSSWTAPADSQEIAKRGELIVSSFVDTDDAEVFLFDLPVYFNDVVVGRIVLGLDQSHLESVRGTTRRMMVMLTCSIVLAVLVVIYFFNRQIAKNLQLMRRTLSELAEGQFGVRISRTANNEFGEIFSAVNAVASTFQSRLETGATAEDGEGPEMEPGEESGQPSKVPAVAMLDLDDMVKDQTIVRRTDRNDS